MVSGGCTGQDVQILFKDLPQVPVSSVPVEVAAWGTELTTGSARIARGWVVLESDRCLALLLPGSVILDSSLCLSEPWLLHLKNGMAVKSK